MATRTRRTSNNDPDMLTGSDPAAVPETAAPAASVPALRPEAGLPAAPADLLSEMAADGQEDDGYQDTGKDDYAIPFLNILQKMSPELEPTDAKYIPEARIGMFADSAVAELLGAEIELVPCFYDAKAVEWRPRDAGGGFAGQHDLSYIETSRAVRNEKGLFVLPSGNYLQETKYIYAIVRRPGGDWRRMILSFKSTQLKKSRVLMTKLRSNVLVLNPETGQIIDLVEFNQMLAAGDPFAAKCRKEKRPLYGNLCHATTVSEKNDKGSWSGWKIELVGEPDPQAYKLAKEFRALVASGAAKAALPDGDPDEVDREY